MKYILRIIHPLPSKTVTYTVAPSPEGLIDLAERAPGCQCTIARSFQDLFKTSEEVIEAFQTSQRAGQLVHVRK